MMRKVTSVALLAIISLGTLPAFGQEIRRQKVDVGGYRLFTSRAGSGDPVVVFEAGLGEDTSTWKSVLPQVAEVSSIFAYDRAGLGESDGSANSKSIEAMVKELRSVLDAAHVSPPYILVGHSLGGAVVQMFAHVYPDEVAGLVLLDPEDGRLLERLKARLSKEVWDAREKKLAQMFKGASPAQKAEIEGSKASGKALAAALPLPNVPILLLTGTLKDPSFPGNPTEQDVKLELHDEFLKTVLRGKHVLVPNSRHYIQEDSPQLVIDAIQQVVTECRKTARRSLPRLTSQG